LASSFLVLGGLKLTGWASGLAHQRFVGSVAGQPANRLAHSLFQQGGMFTGILLGHSLEQWTGLRRPVAGATTLVDSLAMLLQFNVAGGLTRHAFGERFQNWERQLDLSTERLSRGPRPPIFTGLTGGGSVLAPAGLAAMARPRGSTPESRIPGNFAMASMAGDLGSASQPESSLERSLEYPPEIDRQLTDLETQMRTPNYLEGTREELLAKRPSMQILDTVWFHQVQSVLARIPFVKVRMLDATALAEPLQGVDSSTDPELLRRSVEKLGPEYGPASLSRQVMEVRFDRSRLTEGFLNSNQLESCLLSFSNMSEAQERLSGRLHFISMEGEEFVGRIPSVSLYEKILQEAFGAEAAQIHPVEGTIPRDQVMALRARRVSPLGFSRHRLILGDVGEWVFPFSFSFHDGFFHTALDSAARDGVAAFSGRIYRWLQGQSPAPRGVELLLDSLSDNELGIASNLTTSSLFGELHFALNEAAGRLGEISDSAERSARGIEIRDLALEMVRLIREEKPDATQWTQDQIEVMGQMEALASSAATKVADSSPMERVSVELPGDAPTFEYPREIQEIWGRLEDRFNDPNYYSGDRSALMERRPAFDDIERLWQFQAEDYARRIPGATWEWVDAEAIRYLPPFLGGENNPVFLTEAFSVMGPQAAPGHAARRVLRIGMPMDFLSRAYTVRPSPMRYLMVPPPLVDTERHFGNQLGLVAREGDQLNHFIPALGLLRGFYQRAHGSNSVDFFPVPGIASRGNTAMLRSRRLTPVGFAHGLTYLADLEYDVHPFTFTAHDAFFHGGRDASLPDPLPELAGAYHLDLQRRLSAHPASERILDALSDLEFDSQGVDTHWRFYRLFMAALEKSLLQNESIPGLHGVADQLRDFAISEYRRHPQMAGNEKYLISALQKFKSRL
ncbi:MAG: hypothetical protein K8R69_08590, partial [Deltaproteobacteria bacterium]|nr:hypothetical protein [Deltaproteobacteria bacterium]